MAGTYWLTILPDASKLETGIKNVVKKASTDIKRGNTIGPDVIFGDDRKWRDKARDIGKRVREEMRDSGAGEVLHDMIVNAGDEAARQVGRRVGDALSDSPVAGVIRGWSNDVADFATKANGVADSVGAISDAVMAKDLPGTLQSVADGLRAIDKEGGAGGVADILDKIGSSAKTDSTELSSLSDAAKGIGDGFSGFNKEAPGIEGHLGKIGELAGGIGNALQSVQQLMGILNDPKTNETLSKLPGMGTIENAWKMPGEAGDWLRQHLGGALPDLSHWDGFQSLERGKKSWWNDPKTDNLMGGGGTYATGGLLSGPGTGTSDSMVIRASTGEFVVKQDATAKWLPFLQAINADKITGFANGGLVGDQINSLPEFPTAWADSAAVASTARASYRRLSTPTWAVPCSHPVCRRRRKARGCHRWARTAAAAALAT